MFWHAKCGYSSSKNYLNAIKNGIIQRGEAGLRKLGIELEKLLRIDVDFAVIKAGGPFDQGPFIYFIK